jgi:hypothetical protein
VASVSGSAAHLICPPLLHEAPDELRNLIRRGIERKMTRIEDVDFGLRHVAAIGLRYAIERSHTALVHEAEMRRSGTLTRHSAVANGRS